MEKERDIQCVPVELIARLKTLAARLWDEKNPASVQLNAVMEEFEPDVKTLGNIISQYDADYSGRLALRDREAAQKEGRLKEELEDFAKRFSALESSHAAALRKIAELKAAVSERDGALAELKSRVVEEERGLNAKYVAKMQDLYDKVSKKELEMLAHWEEKNKGIETLVQGFESEHAARIKQLELRQRALEEDYNVRKDELARSLADAKARFEAREKGLESDFNARKSDLIRTFDKIKAGLDARERSLSEREAARAKGGGL